MKNEMHMLDKEGRITSWNAGAEWMKGGFAHVTRNLTGRNGVQAPWPMEQIRDLAHPTLRTFTGWVCCNS